MVPSFAVGNVKRNVNRIINETQIITHAAEEGRADVIARALRRIEDILDEIGQELAKAS